MKNKMTFVIEFNYQPKKLDTNTTHWEKENTCDLVLGANLSVVVIDGQCWSK